MIVKRCPFKDLICFLLLGHLFIFKYYTSVWWHFVLRYHFCLNFSVPPRQENGSGSDPDCASTAITKANHRLHISTLPVMNKTEFYLSRCTLAASASDMQFSLGSILVKGGKILSSGHNHHRYATPQKELAWI
jgi:hypothetical protein